MSNAVAMHTMWYENYITAHDTLLTEPMWKIELHLEHFLVSQLGREHYHFRNTKYLTANSIFRLLWTPKNVWKYIFGRRDLRCWKFSYKRLNKQKETSVSIILTRQLPLWRLHFSSASYCSMVSLSTHSIRSL